MLDSETGMTILGWKDIGDAPSEPGVYAWYYRPEISSYDIRKAIESINALKSQGEGDSAINYITDFLEVHLFSYFREQPYNAVVRGPLKPRYEGELQHRSSISPSLIDRLVETPERLATLKAILERSAPSFASPIYIGMSQRLRARLSRHKSLIEGYGARPVAPLDETDERDQNFAREVCARNIPPPRLFVVVQPIPDGDNAYVDVENILNRIHHPLFGRN